jgi:trehalose 6-phosphate synthase
MSHMQPCRDLDSKPAALPQANASQQPVVGLVSPSAATRREAGVKLRSANVRLIVVATRLPVRRVRRSGVVTWERSPGGLVSALWPLLEGVRGTWVGWSGTYGKGSLPDTSGGLILEHVPPSRAEVELFYMGFANTILWPLYHDAVRWPEFERRWWKPHVEVNRRFAAVAVWAAQGANPAEPAPLIWVHDYQLQLVPQYVREALPNARIGFFLHIPFPPGELFAQLPWREQILRGLLEADVVGFQTRSGVRNFLEVVQRYLGLHAREGELVV